MPLLPTEACARIYEYIAYFFNGPDGAAPPANLGVTLPDMLRRVTAGLVLAWIVTVGDCAPDLAAELNTTFTKPVFPGWMGALVQSGLVQPQEAVMLEMTKGA